MSYSVFAVLFGVSFFFLLAGLLTCRDIDDLSPSVASSIAILSIFLLFIASFSSYSSLVSVFQAIAGGIPFVQNIADFSTLQNLLHVAPWEAAKSFLDVFFLSFLIDLISLLPLQSGPGVHRFMTSIFCDIVVALISLFLLNYVLKPTFFYTYLVYPIFAVISLLTAGSIPLGIYKIVAMAKTIPPERALFDCILFSFFTSQNMVARIFRRSLFTAIVYTAAIYIIELRFGTVAQMIPYISLGAAIFGPVLVSLIGVVIMVRAAFR